MFVVRLIGVATAVALGVALLLWLLTSDRKWLQIAWRIFKYALFLSALILLLFLAESLVVAL